MIVGSPSPPHVASPRARRLAFAAAAPVVVALGAALRFGLSGYPADAAGGVAYAALIYLLAGFARPTAAPRALAAVALTWCVVIELAQLTAGPRELVAWWEPLRLVTGSSFAWADLPPYAVGAALAWVADGRLAARGAARRR